MRLALIRHPALRIPPGICYGRTDFPLSDPSDIAGIVRHLADYRPAVVWASPAPRCRRLAEAIASPSLVFDPRLLEIDFGAWEGLAWDHIPRAALDRWAADPFGFAPPGGETGQALIARVTACFQDIATAGIDQAIVTHGGPLRILACLARGQAVDLMSPSPTFGSVELVSLKLPVAVPP